MADRVVPAIDLDDYGFDLVGRDWTSFAQERVMLIGLSSLDRDLYYTCLLPFANKAGDVVEASYYRFIKMLTPRRNPRGGKQPIGPTKKQLRGSLARLRDWELIKLFLEDSMREGVLKIRVVRRFGAFSSDSERAGVRAVRKRRATRANSPISS